MVRAFARKTAIGTGADLFTRRKKPEDELVQEELPVETEPQIDLAAQARDLQAGEQPLGLEGEASSFVEVETGKTKGIQLPDGRVFFGLNKDDLANIIRQQGIDPANFPNVAERVVNEQEIIDFLAEVTDAEAELLPSQLQQELAAGRGEGRLEVPERRAERLAERGAALGLKPAEIGGNIILQGLEKITGNEFEDIDAAELAETPFGKVLGLTTLGVGGGLLVAALAPIVTTAVGILSAKLGTAAGFVRGGVAVGAGALGVGKIEEITDRVLQREDAQELQSAVSTMGQLSTDIVATVKAEGITRAQGIAEINREEADLNIMEGKLKQAAALDPRVKTSGAYVDIMKDIMDSRNQFRTAKAEILQLETQFNPNELLILNQKFKDIEAGKLEAIQPLEA